MHLLKHSAPTSNRYTTRAKAHSHLRQASKLKTRTFTDDQQAKRQWKTVCVFYPIGKRDKKQVFLSTNATTEHLLNATAKDARCSTCFATPEASHSMQ